MDVKPGIWWFWGESVTTDYGITKDLEAMKRVGFGSVVLYEQVFSDAPDALKSLSPEFLDRVKFAAAECKRLGLTLNVNSADGYVSGGPWITPALSMQRLVASEINVEGGKRVQVKLPRPPTVLGYYRDVAVLAYPTNQMPLPEPIYTAPPGIDAGVLFDATTRDKVKFAAGARALVTVDFGSPVTLRAITYHMKPVLKALVIATQMPGNWSADFLGQGMRPIPNIGQLEASNDGLHWRVVRALPGLGYLQDTWDQRTFAFAAVTARYFRLDVHDWNAPGRHDALRIGGVRLIQEARIDQWETKAADADGLRRHFPCDRKNRRGMESAEREVLRPGADAGR
jgi:(4-O-methyl)-D-glucuronate---lignin esterase